MDSAQFSTECFTECIGRYRAGKGCSPHSSGCAGFQALAAAEQVAVSWLLEGNAQSNPPNL